jgi:hypothetical protein
MNAPLEHAFQLGAGPSADCFDPLAAFAEHDRALARPLDKDHLLDSRTAVLPVLPALGLYGRAVRKLVTQLQEYLFARDLRGDQPFGHVG